MKRIKELSIYELAELADEDFKKLVELEKAEQGIPLCLPDKPVAETLPLITPVGKAYKVNIDGFYLTLRSNEDVEKVINFLIEINPIFLNDVYIDGIGYRQCNSGKNIDHITIETKLIDIFDHDDIDSYIKAKYDFDEKGRSYQDRLKAYEEVVNTCREFEEGLWDEKRSAESFMHELNRKTKSFGSQYIPLCDGVPDDKKEGVAMAFFEKAYDITDQEREYILSNYKQLNN